MLDDGRVCWWKRMPTAEMGCGTCDPKEVVFSFPFLPRQERAQCEGSEAHRQVVYIQYCAALERPCGDASCMQRACSCCPLGSSVGGGDWAIEGLHVVRSQMSLPIGPWMVV